MSETPQNETPLIEIDLTAENKTGHIDENLLSQWEREELEALLADEKEGIITLTQEELQELKTLISPATENPWESFIETERQRGANIDQFIEEQKLEGMSLSDLASGIEWVPPELLEAIQSQASEILFGSTGLMDGATLSESSKNSITLSLILEILDQENLSLENLSQIWQEMNETFSKLRDVFHATETVWPGIQKNRIDIAGEGENNVIFSDVMSGKIFFQKIFAGEITAENVESIVESEENLRTSENPGPQDNILALQNIIRNGLENFIPRESETWNQNPTIPTPDKVRTAGDEALALPAEERQTLIERLKNGNAFERFFAILLEAFQNFWLYTDGWENTEGEWDTETPTDTTDEEESRTQENTAEDPSIMNLFEKIQGLNSESPTETSFIDEIAGEGESNLEATFLEELRGDIHLQEMLEQTIESISLQESLEESFAHIFEEGTPVRIGEITSTFDQYGLSESFPEGTSIGQKVLKYLQEYALYRNDPEVQGKTSDRLTWQEYAQRRKAEWWNFRDR